MTWMKARLHDIETLTTAFVAERLRGEKHLDAPEWFRGSGAERTYPIAEGGVRSAEAGTPVG